MKLFYISKNGCQDIKLITKGIKKAYQLEQEFNPYLSVEFLPNNKYKEGIFLVIGNNNIHKNYYLQNEQELQDLRNTIWSLFSKYYNITDIAKNGYLDFIKLGKNNVTIGWSDMMQKAKNHKIDIPKYMLIDQLENNEFNKQMSKNILHPVYKNSGNDIQNRKLCFTNRIKECTDNYPINSQTYNLCHDNVTWLCKNGYPYNVRTKVMSAIVKKQIEDSLKYLKSTNMKSDKQHYDDLILSGFFERPANRMGNKYSNLTGKHAIDFIAEKEEDYAYYSKLIEGFDDNVVNRYWLIVIVIMIILISWKILI